MTSKAINFVAVPELEKRAAQKLLTHVVLGEFDKAEIMIKTKPQLLLIKSTAIDFSGRTILGTAFQAAIGAGDKPMWEMILPYFEVLEKPEEALSQFQKQFPEGGVKEDVSAEILNDYYNAIALGIIQNKDNALSINEDFRKNITRQTEIKQGIHFNLKHVIAAYQAYYNNYDLLYNDINRN
ncbi:hypothetical protein [Legionella gresilensis]|uniref:hypothetical protein n=1 Tax=Legionella gresilensis TaxID=91823 RepID=UPI001040F6AF|nr:hypothetical protein [Legionella gresilensis]